MSKRKNISKSIKKIVIERQKGKCACCMEKGERFHHVFAVSRCEDEIYSFEKNIVYLCSKHHDLFHLGHPDTFRSVYEYVWYLYFHKLPEKEDIIDISNKVLSLIEKDIKERSSNFNYIISQQLYY